jgi:hypothetical protein
MLILLIIFLVFFLIVSIVMWVNGLSPIPAPFGNVVVAIVSIIALIYLLEVLVGGGLGLHWLR